MVSEGVSLDIIQGVAIFTSNLTGHVITSRNLKGLNNFDDVVMLVRELAVRQWFTQAMQNQIERFVISDLRRF